MILPADQAYLRTRLTILYNRLRTPREIEQLIAMAPEELLSSFHVEPAGATPSGRMMQQFEQSMLQVWLDEMGALLRPLHGPARDILVQWARRYELYNLKALIRGKLAGLPNAQISESLFRLPGFLSLDHDKLLHTDDVTELLRRLEGTPYQSIARQAHHRFLEKQDPFLLDAALDLFFYAELCRRTQALEPLDRAIMEELLGRIIDRHNLIWMMRYRYNYALSPAEALYLSIDHGHRLDRGTLAHLVEAPNIQDFLAALPDSVRRITGNDTNLVVIESRLQQDLKHHSEQYFRTSPSIVAVVLSYLILRYMELQVLYAILQSRLLGFSDDLLREALQPSLREAA